MSARIVVTLILEYDGNDVAEYDAAIDAMQIASQYVEAIGEEVAAEREHVRVVDVQVSG